MNAQNLFRKENGRIRTLWRILLFISIFLLAISPLILIDNSHLQFFGVIVILISALYLNSRYLDKLAFSEYGLAFNKETFTYLIIGVLLGFSAVVMIFFLGISTNILTIAGVRSALDIPTALLFAVKMLLVGILEETFFRGYLFTTIYDGTKSNSITKKQALLIAMMVSSVIFGLAHISTSNASILSILFLTVNGIVWCIPFIITKNLGLSIGMHAAWNFTQTQIGFTMSGNKTMKSFFRIENNGPDLLTGGAYGPEAGILGLIGFVIMLLLSLLYLKLQKKLRT